MKKRISPGLMIYKASRYSEIRPNSLKYGLCPHRFVTQNPSKLQKRFLSLSMKKFLLRASHSITPDKPLKASSLQMIAQIRNIKHLDLSTGLAFSPNRRQQTRLDLYQSKVAKRILRTCSKITRLTLMTIPMHSQCIVPFKHTNLLASLRHFKCFLFQGFYQHLQILSTHLLRNRQKQTHAFDISVPRNWEPGHYKDAIERLALVSPHSKVELMFGDFPDATQKETAPFAQMLQSLPNLRKLSLKSSPTENFLHFLKEIQGSQNLQSLFLTLSAWKKTSEILKMLPKLFHSLESLTDLQLKFENFNGLYSLDFPLFQDLDKCTKITALRLNFLQCNHLNDAICDSLIHSLKNMKALKDLSLEMQSFAIASSKIQEIWTILGSLTCLEILYLNVQKFEDEACDEEFGILCKSLKKLSKLEILFLKMNDCHIDDTGIIQLSKAISGLDKLRSLDLDFSGAESKWILGDNLSRLGKSFENKKALSDLVLKIKCLDIDDLCARTLISSLRSLKSLNKLDLNLESVDLEENIEQFLKQNLEQLKLQYDVSFCLDKERNEDEEEDEEEDEDEEEEEEEDEEEEEAEETEDEDEDENED